MKKSVGRAREHVCACVRPCMFACTGMCEVWVRRMEQESESVCVCVCNEYDDKSESSVQL